MECLSLGLWVTVGSGLAESFEDPPKGMEALAGLLFHQVAGKLRCPSTNLCPSLIVDCFQGC